MKKLLVPFAVAFLFFAGCKSESNVDDIRKEIEALKSNEIASVNSQITSIKTSIGDLQKVDAELKGYIKTLQDAVGSPDSDVSEKLASILKAIEDLKKADASLEKKISDLNDYCDQQNSDTREWVTTTFTTLEQHSAVLNEIASIKLQLGDIGTAISNLDAGLSKKISDTEDKVMAAIGTTESSVKSWVNEQLSGYYTIAAADAKLKFLEDAYKAGDASLAEDINTLKSSLNIATSDLTIAYQKAIADAITENNGTINKKISDDIKAATDNLQSQINAISTRIDYLESRVAALEASVSELIGMVQSIVVVPDYTDGSVKMTLSTENILRFEVYPLTAAKDLAEKGTSVFSLDCMETQTKAGSLINLPISKISFDGEFISIVADGSVVSEDMASGISGANARLRISSGNVTRSSEYFQLTYVVNQYNPLAETVGVSNVSAISAILEGKANLGSTASSDLMVGFQYSKSAGILPSNSITVEATDADAGYNYSAGITGLEVSTTYYFRSFVRQNGQDTYGETKEFTTKDIASLIETNEASDIEATKATMNAKLDLTDVQYESLVYGFLWGSSEDELDTNFSCSEIAGNAISAHLSGLAHKTQYWYKAYVNIDNNTFNGAVKTFITDVIPVESIFLDRTEYIFHTIGNMLQLIVTVLPAAATDKSIVWSSDNEDVVTVNQWGIVEAVGNGTATIIATTIDQGLEATCEVTVAQYVTGITLNSSNLFLKPGDNYSLEATVLPANAYDQTLSWASSNTSVATVDADGVVSAVADGTTTITAVANDGSEKQATCSVSVYSPGEAVDLGLSVKWSSWNLGATKPEEYGDYFAWGGIEPYYINGHSQDSPCSSWRVYKSGYNWTSYQWSSGSSSTLTKYNTSSSYGTIDNKTSFKDYDYEDDAARVALGGNWRTPTAAEWAELRYNCTWTWTSNYNGTGVAGRIVTSVKEGYTDKSIFLPAAGGRGDTTLSFAGSSGYYWTSSIILSDRPDLARSVDFGSVTVMITDWSRCNGFSVRPVSE